jgi:hypothetical protein
MLNNYVISRSFIALAELNNGKKLETLVWVLTDINKNILKTLDQERFKNEIKELLQMEYSIIRQLKIHKIEIRNDNV